MEKAYLVLANGDVFEGTRLGAPVDATGELVFNTGMSGYIETLNLYNIAALEYELYR